ncbi:MAG: hypothetical protein LUE92_04705 [Clostridiales bacterium]|nr:hypothetical protein [Clostridiales bacterium]
MACGKAMKLFLMDDVPGGRMKCSLANWVGVAYKVPRTLLERCKDMRILKQSGVYFLFGTGKEQNPVVYIGRQVPERTDRVCFIASRSRTTL